MTFRPLILSAIATVLMTQAYGANEKNYTYLALGDSIPFGLDATKLPPYAPFDPTLPVDTLVGYPDDVASRMHLLQSKKMINASCPGETSSSFYMSAVDNGCMSLGPQGQLPFRPVYGLHFNYQGYQQQFALSQLATNKHINLVTLSIGGNDLLLLAKQCSAAPVFAACVQQNVAGVLGLYAANLTEILSAIRSQYSGTLVLVEYYSPTADPVYTSAVAALNQVMLQVGSAFHATFADGFTAFRQASAGVGYDPCAAGLLVQFAPNVCDIHPSPLGRQLLGATIVDALSSKSK